MVAVRDSERIDEITITIEQLKEIANGCADKTCEMFVDKQIRKAKEGGKVDLDEVGRAVARSNERLNAVEKKIDDFVSKVPGDNSDKFMEKMKPEIEKLAGAAAAKMEAAKEAMDRRAAMIDERFSRQEEKIAKAQASLEEKYRHRVEECPNCSFHTKKPYRKKAGKCTNVNCGSEFSSTDKGNNYKYCPGCKGTIEWGAEEAAEKETK